MGNTSLLYTVEGWFQALHSPEFVAYLTVSRPPHQGSRREVRAARDALRATPLIQDLLATQRPEGDWPSYAPCQRERLRFRQFPIPLTVLCMAGYTLDDEPVRRAGRYLLSTLHDGVFRNPWQAIDEPLEYYEAHIGHCLEAVAAAGLAGQPGVQRAVRVALAHQRWDGGWSTSPGEAETGPPPSCPLCTAAMVRGLGAAARLGEAAVERIMAYGLDERARPPAIPELLLQLEFLARQGRRKGDPHVARLLERLEAARDEQGRFPAHPGPGGEYPSEHILCQYDHLRWWLGGDWPGS